MLLGLLGAFITGVVLAGLILALRRDRARTTPRGRFATGTRLQWGTPILRPCPDCAELVLREAKSCKYCGCLLVSAERAAEAPRRAPPA